MAPCWKSWKQPPSLRNAVLLPGRVAEAAGLPAHVGPALVDRAADDLRPGGGGPVDGPSLERLEAASLLEAADDVAGGRADEPPGVGGVGTGHDGAAGRELRGAEPVGVVEPEVAVAVGRAAVARPVAGVQRRLVGPVGRVVVQPRRRLVPDADHGGAAGTRDAPLDDVVAPGPVAVVRRVRGVPLVLPGRVVQLPLQAGVVRVAPPGPDVRAVVAGCPVVHLGRRVAAGDEPHLLLQQHQDDPRVDAARGRDLGDDLRGALPGRALVPRAQVVRGLGGRVHPEVLETGAAVVRRVGAGAGAPAHQEALDGCGIHRAPVEEHVVGDDVAGVELPRVGRLRLLDRRARGHRAQQRSDRDDEDGEDAEDGAHHGTSTSTASPAPREVSDS